MTGDPRLSEVRAFVRRVFGLRGALRLHRSAIGFDLLRSPVNVVLAPVFLLVKLMSLLAGKMGWPKTALWLASRQIFFETQVAARVADEVRGLLDGLEARRLLSVSPELREVAVRDYVATRSAVAEMVTTGFVLLVGVVLFQSATPGMISLAGPMAEMRAMAEAVAEFPLGSGLGRMYYRVFPVALPVWQVALTGVVLAMLGGLVTTFAGVLADPVQVVAGVHRRRLMRMIVRLERAESEGLAREHLFARAGDLSDMALGLWRAFRG